MAIVTFSSTVDDGKRGIPLKEVDSVESGLPRGIGSLSTTDEEVLYVCLALLADARFFELQLKFDADLAAEARAARCRDCGGRLDSAKYPRKPRGALRKLPDDYETKFSFCCARCRHRNTPPSVRFLGRRVYLGAVVVLATALQQGLTPVRAARLRQLLGVSRRTLDRWRVWWREAFVESDFWKAAKVFFSPPVAEAGLSLSLLERFGSDEEERLAQLLRFLMPISPPAGYVADRRLRGSSSTRRGGF
jgi:hypothetical protein